MAVGSEVPCSLFRNWLFSQRHAAVGAICLTFPPFDLLRTILVTRLPWNFGFRCELSTRKHRNSRLASVFLNIFLLTEREVWRNPSIWVIASVKLHCLCFLPYLFPFSMTSVRFVWGFMWQGQEPDVGRNMSMLSCSFSITFVYLLLLLNSL